MGTPCRRRWCCCCPYRRRRIDRGKIRWHRCRSPRTLPSSSALLCTRCSPWRPPRRTFRPRKRCRRFGPSPTGRCRRHSRSMQIAPSLPRSSPRRRPCIPLPLSSPKPSPTCTRRMHFGPTTLGLSRWGTPRMPSPQVHLNIGPRHSQCKCTRRHWMNKSPRGNHCSLVGRSRPAPCRPSTPCTPRPRWRLRSARSSKHRTMGPPRMQRENRHRKTCSFWIEQAPLCRACKPCSLPIALSPASQHRKLCSWLQLAPRQLRFPPSTQCSRPSPPWVRTSRPCFIAHKRTDKEVVSMR